MKDRPKTKSQRKAWFSADAASRAAAVAGSAGTTAISQAVDRLGTPTPGRMVL